MTNKLKERIFALRAEGMTYRDIAKAVGVPESTLRYHLRGEGKRRKAYVPRPDARKYRRWAPEVKAEMRRLYLEVGLTAKQIAARYELCDSDVYRLMGRVKARVAPETIKLVQERHRKGYDPKETRALYGVQRHQYHKYTYGLAVEEPKRYEAAVRDRRGRYIQMGEAA